MATLILTNITDAQALRGQGVRVTLSWDQSNTYLQKIETGMNCEVDSSSIQGVVASVDKLGHSFLAVPANPTESFGDNPGYLNKNATVNVFTT